ncbi:hypothetical protein [Kitasatospora kifunensis]|uniref:Uncharacterized protein n=1 Tax=Kitasatospora kifunensis TaxID=58351 RepID=A0A7W7RCZ1_KITKI|nr:hypothetical protein [Kitasatospora kifunensis]MBB4929096.1 hypothetical protein [Kitasatospora kifunensis]
MGSSTDLTPFDTAPWAALRKPDDWTVHRMRHACEHLVVLTPCGRDWDAIVVAPLDRGLAALDTLDLPLDAGYAVLADYSRRELVVLAAVGTADSLRDLPGVRVLSAGSWLLLPHQPSQCHYSATWLSGRGEYCSAFLNPAELRDALLDTDAQRARQGFATLCRAAADESATAP